LDSEKANFDGNFPYGDAPRGEYRLRTTPVGSFKPNRYGLYDMHGNVWEWCEDYYGPYNKIDTTKDPVQSVKQNLGQRVLRGGAWISDGTRCRAAFRHFELPDVHNDSFGLRLVLRQDSKE